MSHRDSVGQIVLIWASIVVGSSLVARPHVAKACGAAPCAQLETVFPHEGATNVPTNTELRVQYFGTLQQDLATGGVCMTAVLRMRLVPDAAAAITLQPSLEIDDGSRTWLIANPSAPLQPGTHYVLQVDRLEAAGMCACGATPDWTMASDFTTGTGADTQRPVFGGFQAIEATQWTRSSTDCGRTFSFQAMPVLTPGSDDFDDLSYQLYVDGKVAQRYIVDPTQALLVTCDGNVLFGSWPLRPGALIELRAVDVAGNLSEAHPAMQVPAGCPESVDMKPLSLDAGPGSPSQSLSRSPAGAAGSSSATAVDAGTRTHPSTDPQPASCSSAGPGSSAGARSAGWVFLLLLLPWTYRRSTLSPH
jgi:hypothetical protein